MENCVKNPISGNHLYPPPPFLMVGEFDNYPYDNPKCTLCGKSKKDRELQVNPDGSIGLNLTKSL